MTNRKMSSAFYWVCVSLETEQACKWCDLIHLYDHAGTKDAISVTLKRNIYAKDQQQPTLHVKKELVS